MKRTKKSQKKTKFLLLLIVLTAILSITATYAWFSSQRDVEIVGMKLNVETAENMQISLDGAKWTQSITIGNMRQFYGTYAGTETFVVYQANEDENTNYVPTELLPVSTIGEVSSGKLQLVSGELKEVNGVKTLESVALCDETDLAYEATVDTKQGNNKKHPYLVFDMYLRNISKGGANGTTPDPLLLNAGSRVWVDNITTTTDEGTGVVGTGLENGMRVGFIPYKTTAALTAEADDIRALAATAETGEKVSIWEPNDLAHTADAIANSKRTVVNGTTLPTYGLKATAAGKTIADVEATEGDYVAQQMTMKPTYDASTGAITAPTAMTYTDASAVALEPNKITKVRVYIWLEGQDVDCNNTASTGSMVQATVKLTRNTSAGGNSTSYTGDGTGAAPEPGGGGE